MTDTLIALGLLVILGGVMVLFGIALDGGWERDHGRSLWRGEKRTRR